MKARVKVYLNERTQKPSVNAPNYKYYKPGDTIEIVDIVNGDYYEGNNVWYKLNNDSYVWSGGVEDTEIKYNYVKGKLTIHEKFKIKGENVNIAIIDSGINIDVPFKNQINHELTKKYFNDTKLFNDLKNRDIHGTQVASIISFNNKNYAMGLAPEAKLIDCKITNNKYLIYRSSFLKALEWCVNNEEVHIINCSLAIISDDQKIRDLINKAIERNKIIVGAVDINSSGDILYPAKYAKVFGIAAVDIYDERLNGNIKSDGLDFYTLGKGIDVLDKYGKIEKVNGSSFSTAYFSGFSALAISAYFNKYNKFPNNCFEWLFEIITLTVREQNKPFYGKGIIDPVSTINQIINNLN